MTKDDIFYEARKSGIGEDAARTLWELSPGMLTAMVSHYARVVANHSADTWVRMPDSTFRGLRDRGLLRSGDAVYDAHRRCTLSPHGRKVERLYRLLVK